MKKLSLIVLLITALHCLVAQPAPPKMEKALQNNIKIKIENAFDANDYVLQIPEDKIPARFRPGIYTLEIGKARYPIFGSVDLFGKRSYFALVNLSSKDKNATMTLSHPTSAVIRVAHAELSHKTGGKWVRNPKTRCLEYAGGSWTNTDFLRIPDEYNEHSSYIRFDGVGWENDKIAYRAYLDWRNGYDIFGKKTQDIILPDVGVADDFSKMQDWGMDIGNVDDALGIGSFGYWTDKVRRVEIFDSLTCEILSYEDLRSQVQTTFYGWNYNYPQNDKTTATSLLSIDVGSRLTHQELKFSQSTDNICTGFSKNKNAELVSGKRDGTWAAIASWGKQSANNDNLGLAIIFRNSDVKQITEDDLNHVIVFNSKEYVDYYFLAAWELENNGITTKEQFVKYINEVVQQLNNPAVLK